MNIPLEESTQPDIKEQFKQGPPQPQVPYHDEGGEVSQEEAAERARLTRIFDRDISFMKKRQEYDEVQIQLIEQAVLLGLRPINSVPGLLGMELAIREIKAKEFLGGYANEIQNRINEEQQRLKKEQELRDKEAAKEDTQSPGTDATTN